MPPAATSDYLAQLNACGLVTADELAPVVAWTVRNQADPTEVARELVRRGLLTQFQVKEIYRGRGADLSIGPYRLLELLGEGGMGRVYKAYHIRLGRVVALKVIRREKLGHPLTVKRFHQEIQAVAQLSHPNVIVAFDADATDGHHYFAMEYVEGLDLTKIVKRDGPMTVPEACEAIRQAALGLHHAFERGLVHRDVKPSNLLRTRTNTIKVLDLGLALLNDASDPAGRITLDGYVVGTPDFLAPEQARSPQTVDTRADVYALGGTLYYLLTGKVPYEAGTPSEKLIRHCVDPVPSVRDHWPDVGAELDALIQQMMAKSPAERPQTPGHAALLLHRFTGGTWPSATVLPALEPNPTPLPEPLPLLRSSQLFHVANRGPTPPIARRGRLLIVWLIPAVGVVLGAALLVVLLTPRPPALAETITIDRLNIKLIRQDAGTVRLGTESDEPSRDANEMLATAVPLRTAYYLGATEVTHGQYLQVMTQSPATHARRVSQRATEMPVDSVSWDEAQEFCKKLTQMYPRQPGWAYRLPTEIEWEAGCRAGTVTPFAFGMTLGIGQAVIAEGVKPPEMPARVAGLKPNARGLSDMHGNLAEWCADVFSRGSVLRAVRGGSYRDAADRCRSSARRGVAPDTRDPSIGFRIAYAPVVSEP